MTLLELMLVMAIMSIVVSIGVPKFAKMIRRANEASTQGKLGAVRSALTIYYADNEGNFPSDLTPMMTPGSKYLTGIIPVYTQGHGSTEGVQYYSAETYADDGGWGYINDRENAAWGKIWVDCTHTDLRGSPWTSY